MAILWYCHALPHGLGAGRPLRGNFGSGKVSARGWAFRNIRSLNTHLHQAICIHAHLDLCIVLYCLLSLLFASGRRSARSHLAFLGSGCLHQTPGHVFAPRGRQRPGGQRNSPRHELSGERRGRFPPALSHGHRKRRLGRERAIHRNRPSKMHWVTGERGGGGILMFCMSQLLRLLATHPLEDTLAYLDINASCRVAYCR